MKREKGEIIMRELKINRIYKHFKGDYYLVIDTARDSETKETCVIEDYMVKGIYGLDQ